MSSSPRPPQPPMPPAPPVPPRSGTNALGIALLILALIVVVAGGAIWWGIRFMARDMVHVQVRNMGGDKKEVSIKTPFGGIEVNKNESISAAALDLPIYPGAHRLKDEGSASMSLGLPGNSQMRIVAGKFETSDRLDKVQAFYADRLAADNGAFTKESEPSFFDGDHSKHGDVGNFTGKDSDGKTVFEMRRSGSERVVALRSELDGTRIELVRINFAAQEAN